MSHKEHFLRALRIAMLRAFGDLARIQPLAGTTVDQGNVPARYQIKVFRADCASGLPGWPASGLLWQNGILNARAARGASAGVVLLSFSALGFASGLPGAALLLSASENGQRVITGVLVSRRTNEHDAGLL